jgi:5'(3')-deoxyribonucleotidase
MRPRVLVDCDGVMADFVGATLSIAHRISSKRWAVEDLKGWDFWESMKDRAVPDLEARIKKAISEEGFCSEIPVIPGAVEGVESLRTIADVVVVTTPWRSRTWAHERFEWLERNFGLHRDLVIQTSNKADVDGDMLVDDSPANLRKWDKRRMERGARVISPVLWAAFHNAEETGYAVAHTWDDVISLVKDIR